MLVVNGLKDYLWIGMLLVLGLVTCKNSKLLLWKDRINFGPSLYLITLDAISLSRNDMHGVKVLLEMAAIIGVIYAIHGCRKAKE